MRWRVLVRGLAVVLVLAGLSAAAWTQRHRWQGSAIPATAGTATPAPPEITAVTLSDEAIAGLNLDVKPVPIETYTRYLEVPGTVVDQPGHSDHDLTAPVAGVITHVHAVPGDIVKPGNPLFTIRLTSEYVQNAQSELFKTAEDIRLNRELYARLEQSRGTVPDARFFEAEQQLRRLEASLKVYRNDLIARGLTAAQVDGVQAGTFVTEVTVSVPAAHLQHPSLVAKTPAVVEPPGPVSYEVQGLKAGNGQQVVAGQVLAELANHQLLLIEGRAFEHEAPQIAAAAREGTPIGVEFPGIDPTPWPEIKQSLVIRSMGNAVDPSSRTLPFFVPLVNQSKSYERGGKTFLIWRYRPGQRVRLRVPIGVIPDVFVLPAGAVVRDGADAYVFRQNGDNFERKPVRVLHEDRLNVVIASGGAVGDGNYLVRNNAATVERALKAAQARIATGGNKPGGHWHADGSYHEGHD